MSTTDRRLTLIEALAEVTRERDELRAGHAAEGGLSREDWEQTKQAIIAALWPHVEARLAVSEALERLGLGDR